MRLGRSSADKGGREPVGAKPPFPFSPTGAAAPTRAAASAGEGAPANRDPGAPALGQLLLGRGTLVADQLTSALLAQTGSGKRLGELLIELGIIAEQDLVVAL